jgi:rod shape-determining protein MreC
MRRTTRTGTRTDLALLGAALALALLALMLPSTVRSRVQGSLRSSIAAPLVSAQAWAERGRLAISDHGRLTMKVDSLALAAQTASPLQAENQRLRAIIGLGQRLGWGFVATELVHPPRGSDEHTVLLAAGAAAGVRPFSPLTVPEGLIGMVTTVEASSSTAILWTHPDFRASATTTDGVAFGIVAAHLGSGADRFLLEMRGVPFRSVLAPGTQIVTSGLGNVFPRGIPIGVVLRETKTVEGWARTYLLKPIVSPDEANAAVVLLPPRAAAGVTGAWISASSSELTQKSIALAGDSIIADSVRKMQGQLAQLALLDSLRRAAIYRGDSGVRVDAADSSLLANKPTPATSAPSDPLPPLPAGAAGAAGATPPPASTPSPIVPAPVRTAPAVTQPAGATVNRATPGAVSPVMSAPRPAGTAPATGSQTRPVTPAVIAPRPSAPTATTPSVLRPPTTAIATPVPSPRAPSAPASLVTPQRTATATSTTAPRTATVPTTPGAPPRTGTATPPPAGTAPTVAAAPRPRPVRRDSLGRIITTPRTTRPRTTADSAGAKSRRSLQPRPPAENPFRLPPAGGHE